MKTFPPNDPALMGVESVIYFRNTEYALQEIKPREGFTNTTWVISSLMGDDRVKRHYVMKRCTRHGDLYKRGHQVIYACKELDALIKQNKVVVNDRLTLKFRLTKKIEEI